MTSLLSSRDVRVDGGVNAPIGARSSHGYLSLSDVRVVRLIFHAEDNKSF
jgi:hypothetical protein